jgi:hypothetical protein
MKVLLGTEAIESKIEFLSATRSDFGIDDDPYFLILMQGLVLKQIVETYSANSLFSLFGRFDYTYADKYIFNITLRKDGLQNLEKITGLGFPCSCYRMACN